MEYQKRTFSDLRTKDETAKALRISTRTLDKFVARGDIAPVRLGDRVLFSEHEISRFIASKTVHLVTTAEPVLATV